MDKPPFVKLTGLWRQPGREGKPAFLSGNLGASVLFVFKNLKRRNDKDPDYIAYLAPSQKRREPTASEAETSDDFTT